MNIQSLHKDLHENVHSSFIQNGQSLKIAQRSVNKLWYLHQVEYHSAIKKEQNTYTRSHVNKFQNDYDERKEGRYKNVIFSMIPFMRILGLAAWLKR